MPTNQAFENDAEDPRPENTRKEKDSPQPLDYSNVNVKPQVFAAAAASLGALVLGLSIGWSSPVSPKIQNGTADGSDLVLSVDEVSWVSSLLTLGALVGGLTGGLLIDIFGRKLVLISINLLFVVGWVLIIAATGDAATAMLYAGRLITGLGGGLCSVATPTYIGEVVIPSVRGTLGNFFQLLIVFGIFLTSLMGLGLIDPNSGFTWRWISTLCNIVPVLFTFAMLFVPESPFYLMKNGRRNEAKESLKWLRGPKYNVEPELNLLEASIKLQTAQAAKFSDVFQWWAAKPLLVAIGLMFFQQMSGINAALFFTVDIFLAAGSDLDPNISTVIVNSVNIGMTVLSVILVDRLGRKVLLLVSEIFMVISLAALGAFFFIKEQDCKPNEILPDCVDPPIAPTIGWLPLVSLILFVAAFAVGLGPMPWLMTSEIVPQKVKGPATSIATFVNWTLAFVVTKTFVDLKAGLTDAGAFWFFCGICVLGIFFCAFAVPETAGKTSDEIQAFFGNGPLANRRRSSASASSPQNPDEA